MIQELSEENDSFAHMLMRLEPLRFCLMVGIPFVATFSEINFSLKNTLLGTIEFIMALSLSTLLWIVWQRGSNITLAHIFLIHAALLFGLLFFLGGFSDIGFIWSLGFPFIACIVTDSVIGGVWDVAYFLGILIAGFFVGDSLSHSSGELVYIGLAYSAMTLVAYCASIRRELQEEMFTEMKARVERLERQSKL